MKETKEKDLVPDPEVEVPKEDVAPAGDHKERMKHLFDKSRKNREELISRDEGEHPDAERTRLMMEEASSGKRGDQQHLDTNREMDPDKEPEVPDAFKHSEEVRRDREEAARQMKEGQEEARRSKHEKEDVNSKADDALPEPDPDAIVTVKILGQEYQVPQQDIDDAGGIELYQKSRAANLRLQRIATFEKALPAKRPQEEVREEQQDADPSPDGLDEADITRLRNRVVDALVDGENIEAVDKVLVEELSSRRKSKPRPQTQSTKPESEPSVNPVIREAQAELEAQQAEDMREANEMMRAEYQDILNDKDALSMARGRFHLLASNPANAGRTQKELSRESANWVRSFGKKFSQPRSERDEVEEDRQQRIVRKRKLPQPSRANAPMVSSEPDEQESTKEKRKKYLEELKRRSSGR